MPKSLKGKGTIIIGNIRNPYAYYVSLWAMGCREESYLYKYIKQHYSDKIYLYEDVNNIENFQTWLREILTYELYIKTINMPTFHDTEKWQDTVLVK